MAALTPLPVHANSGRLLDYVFMSKSPDVLNMAAIQRREATVKGKRELSAALLWFQKSLQPNGGITNPQFQKTEMFCKLNLKSLKYCIDVMAVMWHNYS